MLSTELNEILTRVGPGTPMGELFRRFWLPALVSSELEGPESGPVRLRILCEDLIAFRDSSGRVGIIEAFCSHRRAPLYFGRNEHDGIRCVYHGWKFDVTGQCIDVPNVPDPRQAEALKRNCGIAAYRTREAGGIIWVHMGSNEAEFPEFEWTSLPQGHNYAARWLQRSNYAQGMEGEIDSSHISYLHQYQKAPAEFITDDTLAQDRSPVITLRETDCGFLYGSRRIFNDEYYWRVTQWMAPMYSAIPRYNADPDAAFTGGGRCWVPIDDNHTTTFCYNYRVDRAHTKEEIAKFNTGFFFPPRMKAGVFELPDGQRIDTFLPEANRENDYLLDREMQKTVNFTGIWGVNEQDRALQESMPGSGRGARGISDRSREHLVSSDVAIVTARKRLIKMAQDLANGIEPELATRGDAYAIRAIAKVCKIAELDEFRARYAEEEKVPSSSVPTAAAASA